MLFAKAPFGGPITKGHKPRSQGPSTELEFPDATQAEAVVAAAAAGAVVVVEAKPPLLKASHRYAVGLITLFLATCISKRCARIEPFSLLYMVH